MSALTGNDWNATPGGSSAEMVHTGLPEPSLRLKLSVVRDTLIVFSMQVVFRFTMFLRHLNY